MTPASKASLRDVFAEKNILCESGPFNRDEAITRLLSHLHQNEDGFDKESALQAVLAREKTMPTVVAPGVAFPHARLDQIRRALAAIGVFPGGVDFLAPDRRPVYLVILILTPTSDPETYSRILAAISGVLRKPHARLRLMACVTPAEAYRVLCEDDTSLPSHLCARDMMNAVPVTLAESDDLAAAITALCARRILDIPIVDDEGDLRGMVSVEDLLRLALPEHLLWMEDLSPMFRLQPFAELLLKNQETKIADFMREDFVAVQSDTPAIQLAKIFLTANVRQVAVLEGRRLVGVIDLQRFVATVFWA